MLSCPVYPGLTLIHNLSIKRFYWAGAESRRVFSCHGSMSSECQPVSLNWQFRVVKWVFNKCGMQQRSITLILLKWSEIDILTFAAWERGGLRDCMLREEWGVLMWRVTHPVTHHTSQHWCEIIFSFHRIIQFVETLLPFIRANIKTKNDWPS